MTSGIFAAVSPDSIWVDRAKRQRKDLVNIEELAASITANGLIHPPVIRRDGELIVGERRWTAIKSLGWTSMPVQYVEDLDEDELQAIEYEENVGRVDLPWQDQVMAVHNYHQHRLSRDPDWTISATAERLGAGVSTVFTKLGVAQNLIKGEKLVVEAPKYSVAKNVTQRIEQRKAASAADAVTTTITNKPVERQVPILHADFHEWAVDYTGPRFNFIHCDFPYGVGIDKSDQSARMGHGEYKDSPDVYWELMERLSRSMTSVVSDSAHMMFWFSMDYYHETLEQLRQMGWKVLNSPLIWVKSDNTGILPDANRQPRRIYETAFFCSRGDRYIKTSVANAFLAPGREKSIHMNEKPVAMLRHFFRMFVDDTSRVLDPTAGSGNALKAAAGLGASHVLGLERDLEFYTRAKEAYYGLDL